MHIFKPNSKVLYLLVSLIYHTMNLQSMTFDGLILKLKIECTIGLYLFRFTCWPSFYNSDMSFVSSVHFHPHELLSICPLASHLWHFRHPVWFIWGTSVSVIILKVWKPFRCLHNFLPSLYYLYYTYLHIFFSKALPIFPICGLPPSYPQQAVKFSFVLSHLHLFFYLIMVFKAVVIQGLSATSSLQLTTEK